MQNGIAHMTIFNHSGTKTGFFKVLINAIFELKINEL